MTKQAIRRSMLEKLRQQPEEARVKKSRLIAERVRRLTPYRKAKVLLCYVAIDGEVETRPILTQALADGKRVAVPVTLEGTRLLAAVEVKDPEKELAFRGLFGIPEPAPISRRRVAPKELDLILVPGVAFDRQGRRLGRGLGYFDRFLGKVPPAVPRIGLGFKFQLVKQIPFELHDQPVCKVVTD